MTGPVTDISKKIYREKYFAHSTEGFEAAMRRIAHALADNNEHEERFFNILIDQRFLPAGRVQAAVGTDKNVTAMNCFVSGPIEDSIKGIMEMATEAAQTMKMGGGIGYNFSSIRPRGSLVETINAHASGPMSFMEIYDAVCGTVCSAGNRRGAQMGVLDVSHPDIEDFIHYKRNSNKLTNFNISINVSDHFMSCVRGGQEFPLRWGRKVFKMVDARALWNEIMLSNWDWAEPGVLFLDRYNKYNNMWYAENIRATNPCGEQGLPPYGNCLLGSFNIVKYYKQDAGGYSFDAQKFAEDIGDVVCAMDNVVDRTKYPLEKQEAEGKAKRRMGLGVTGLANAIEYFKRHKYGTPEFVAEMEKILGSLSFVAYQTSISRAIDHGPFPAYDKRYTQSRFLSSIALPGAIRRWIERHGIRNSHLLSIAPTGTISLAADNVSSGIEPVWNHEYSRQIIDEDGKRTYNIVDYALREWDYKCTPASEVTAAQHLDVLIAAQDYVDSSVSKTCNVGPEVSWEDFKQIYEQAWLRGAKGCTTFRIDGKRAGILGTETVTESRAELIKNEEVEGGACFIDPNTGQRECS